MITTIRYYILPLLLGTLLALSGCSRDKALSGESVVERNVTQRQHTDLDRWIEQTLTLPYGIEVVYRWERNTAEVGSYTYPPRAERVRSVLETIKQLWIDLYAEAELGGRDFLKGKAPIKLYMYGGRNVDAHGVELLSNRSATASEMSIYNVNEYDPSDAAKVYILMRSVHHQFARRLGEVFPYDRDSFAMISPRMYTPSTGDVLSSVMSNTRERRARFAPIDYAHKRGFVSLHAMLSAEDDFAELISTTLMHSPREMAQALRSARTPYHANEEDSEAVREAQREAEEAYRALSLKLSFVDDYFARRVGIRLSSLQRASNKLLRAYLSGESRGTDEPNTTEP